MVFLRLCIRLNSLEVNFRCVGGRLFSVRVIVGVMVNCCVSL